MHDDGTTFFSNVSLIEGTYLNRNGIFVDGDPEEIRTLYPLIRSQMLYPGELRGQPIYYIVLILWIKDGNLGFRLDLIDPAFFYRVTWNI